MQVTPIQTANQTAPDPGEHLELLAHHLAENHPGVTKSRQQRPLLIKHLPGWKQTLLDAYQHFRATSVKDPVFSRASEWMLDNFYIVEQTFHQIEEDLPNSYYNQLPKLDATPLRSYPRIFALAWELVGYCQGQLDLAQAISFVQEYQRITPLTVGELWAFPTMLRIGTLEHLAAAVAVIAGIDQPKGPNAQPILPIPPAQPTEAIVANCFLSLRLLSATDWKAFFEQTSRIEQIYGMIRQEFIQAWILTPATDTAVLWKSWREIPARTKKPSHRLRSNTPARLKTSPRPPSKIRTEKPTSVII